MRRSAELRRNAASALLLVGAISLLMSALLGWYVITTRSTSSGSTVTEGYDFDPGPTYVTWNLCSGSACHYEAHANASNAPPYSAGFDGMPVPRVQALYGALGGILVVAGAVGLFAGILHFGFVGNRRVATIVLGLVMSEILLGASAPALVTADNAAALRSDLGANSTVCGPCNSFYGSNSSGGTTVTWGPGPGYFLGIAGVAFLLIGLGVWARARGIEPEDGGCADVEATIQTLAPPAH